MDTFARSFAAVTADAFTSNLLKATVPISQSKRGSKSSLYTRGLHSSDIRSDLLLPFGSVLFQTAMQPPKHFEKLESFEAAGNAQRLTVTTHTTKSEGWLPEIQTQVAKNRSIPVLHKPLMAKYEHFGRHASSGRKLSAIVPPSWSIDPQNVEIDSNNKAQGLSATSSSSLINPLERIREATTTKFGPAMPTQHASLVYVRTRTLSAVALPDAARRSLPIAPDDLLGDTEECTSDGREGEAEEGNAVWSVRMSFAASPSQSPGQQSELLVDNTTSGSEDSKYSIRELLQNQAESTNQPLMSEV